MRINVSDPRTSGVASHTYCARAKAVWETNGGISEIRRKALDLKNPWPDPDSFVADHVTPIMGGGRVDGAVRPAHNRCNIRRIRRCDRNRKIALAGE